jgi:hypothetical protein
VDLIEWYEESRPLGLGTDRMEEAPLSEMTLYLVANYCIVMTV